ncbi:MAG: hypothetical protein ABIK82_16970 [Pseudomonadota bacterium]
MKWEAFLRVSPDGLLHKLEHASSKLPFYQWVRQADWLMRPQNIKRCMKKMPERILLHAE